MDAFSHVAIMFSVACGISFLMHRLKQPLLLGYLLTGVVVGPALFALFPIEGAVSLFAELGIVSLLYVVGLSLNPKVIGEVGRPSFIAGLSQILLTMAIGFGLGWVFDLPLISSVYVAAALAFSSTIVVTKLLADKKEIGRLHGKLAVGILLVQDLAACFLLIGLSAAVGGAQASEAVATAIGTLLAGGILLFLLTKTLLPRVEHLLGASQELLFLFSVAWGMGMAALFHAIGLSLEIGALAAGITLASSGFAVEISAKIRLVRDFFLVAFFVLLGAQLNFDQVGGLVVPAILLSLVVLIGKPLLVQGALRWLGYHPRTGFLTAIPIAQMSEFSLVLALFGLRAGHISTEVATLLAVVAFVTIALSTSFIHRSEQLYERVKQFLFIRNEKKETIDELISYDTVLFGCHRLGYDFLPVIRAIGGSYVVIDFDPEVMQRLQTMQEPSLYGDMSDPEFLEDLDMKRLKLVISTIPDIEANRLFLTKLRGQNTDAIAIFIAHSLEAGKTLYDAGATYVILPHYLGGNMAARMIRQFGLDPSKFGEERDKHVCDINDRLCRV